MLFGDLAAVSAAVRQFRGALCWEHQSSIDIHAVLRPA